MAKLSRMAGSTSHVLQIYVQDSSVTTGAGLTGLAYNTSGLACYYKRNLASASVAVTLADITTLGTYVSGGFKAVDGTNMPGVVEFHPPDAAYAAGAKSVVFILKGAANMAPVLIEVELTGVDNQDAQRGGLAALPAAGTLAVNPTVAATQAFNNTGQTTNLPADLQTIKTQAVTATTGVAFPTLVASTTNITSGTITTVANLTNLPAVPTDWLTAAGVKADAVTKIQAGLSTFSGGPVASVTNPVTVGTNNDKTGYGLSASDQTALYVAGALAGLSPPGTAGGLPYIGTSNNQFSSTGGAVKADVYRMGGINVSLGSNPSVVAGSTASAVILSSGTSTTVNDPAYVGKILRGYNAGRVYSGLISGYSWNGTNGVVAISPPLTVGPFTGDSLSIMDTPAAVANPVTLADASVTSAKFAAVTPGLAGFLERLALLAARFFPVAGGSVTFPKSGTGQLLVKGTGGATLSTQAVNDDNTTQTLGAAS